MKRLTTRALKTPQAKMGALAIMSALAISTSASAEPRYQGPLYWMVGCWQSPDKTNTEVWTAPLGGVMFGYAATIKDGKLTYYEQAHIDLRPPRPIYWVSPDGDRPVAFIAPPGPPAPVVVDKKAKPAPLPEDATFENGDNNFPQRVQFRIDGKNKRGLAASVSKLDGSNRAELTWEKCKD